MSAGAWSRWPAPAKLNLFLHVVGRRDDGYHELQTVFQLLDHGDEVALRVRGDGAVQRSSRPARVPRGRDLTLRAAELLARRCGPVPGVDIALTKRIPVGGGLGGGSSDAATVLVALDRLWSLGLGEDALAEIGLELGADVPVFVRGRSAWAESVGEVLAPLAIEPAWYLVVTPPVHASTGAVFAHPALTRNTPRMTMRDFLRERRQRGGERLGDPRLSVSAILGRTTNDCEPVVRDLHPEVGEVVDWLARAARPRMTGTGASVFASFDAPEAAREQLARMPGRWQGFVARGVDESPLRAGARAVVTPE